MNDIELWKGDCLELMKNIPDRSIDMVLADLPYTDRKRKTTWNEWDMQIDMTELWKQYNRIVKPNGAIVLFASDLFSAKLINSNLANYKYKWIWQKEAGTGFLNAKRMPLRDFEEVLVFYKKQCTYNPQMREGKPYNAIKGSKSKNYCSSDKIVTTENSGFRHPLTVVKFNRDKCNLHPTQKPVALLEYLIKTYTNEGDIVLDNCMGSGSTGVACVNTGRRFIGMELDKEYFAIAEKRIEEARECVYA
jgi:DNA modification methylase